MPYSIMLNSITLPCQLYHVLFLPFHMFIFSLYFIMFYSIILPLYIFRNSDAPLIGDTHANEVYFHLSTADLITMAHQKLCLKNITYLRRLFSN